MRNIRSLSASAGVLIAALGWTVPVNPAPLPDAVPASVFAAPPSMEGASLSPNGQKIAAKMLVNGKQSLVISSVAGGGSPALFAAGDVDVNWWRWVTDDWLVVGLGNTEVVYNTDVYVTRVAGVSADLTQVKPIDWKKSGQFADDVIFVPRDGSTTILLSKQTGFDTEAEYSPSVFEADIATGRAKMILGGRNNVGKWRADNRGNIRVGYGYDDAHRRPVTLYRGPNGGDFKVLPDSNEPGQGIPSASILRPDGSAIGFSDKDGFDEVYRVNLPEFTLGEKLFAAKGYDIDALMPNDDRSDVLGVSYTSNREHDEWLDPVMKAVQRQIDEAVGPDNGHIRSYSRDRSKMIVEVGDASQAGGMFYWDTASGSPNLLGWNNKALQGRKLSPVKTIRFKARDGTEMEAVLTLPRGREAKNLPLIVLPHGGPMTRDYEQFDWWTQYLAEQGYAVIQPNYRGSTGYGQSFLQLGEKEWGLKMQDDLVDAIGWASSQGIADAKRVCIVGGSYGGYAAMRGAQRDGKAYRCAISYAGVSDLKAMMKHDRQFLLGDEAKDYWRDWAPDFQAVSPVFHAAEFTVPILVMHGAKDKRVPVKQSRDMVVALQRAGKPVVYVEQKEGDHHFSREADRLQFLEQMKAFLDKYNPA